MTRGGGRELAGRRALVMGLGSFGGGAGAVRHLASRGARVKVTDLRRAEELRQALDELASVDFEAVLGEHREGDFDEAEVIVANPAVPPDHPLLQRARGRGARILSATQLFLEATRARVAAVTGTQGKSSTCHFLASLVRASGRTVLLGGNFGGSLLDQVDAITEDVIVVLELSSYQLESLEDPRGLAERVEAVAITNVLEDHLERHGSADAYRAAKLKILDLLGEHGTSIVPADGGPWPPPRPGERRIAVASRAPEGPPGADELFLTDSELRLGDEVLGHRAGVTLRADFEHANVLVALGLARALGIEAAELAPALPLLGGLPHRLEDLGLRGGRRWIDNAVSTTPDSTISALRALDAPCTLLAGGRLKRLSLDELAAEARSRVRLAVCFGEAAAALAQSLEGAGVATVRSPNLEEAVRTALERTPAGHTILFSPACSSFDAFPNFRERARAFRGLLPEGAGA